MDIIQINSENFDEIISKDTPVLIDFYADWCGPCKMLSPIVEEVAAKYDNIAFGKLNVDENPEICEKFGIMSIPTLIFFKNGEAVETSVGLISEERLVEIISQ